MSGILELITLTAAAVGGVCTAVDSGKKAVNEVKDIIAERKQKKNPEKLEEKNSENNE